MHIGVIYYIGIYDALIL